MRPCRRYRPEGSDEQCTRPIRLLIVDDHPIVRDGLRGVFADDPDFMVVGEAGNGAEAIALATQLQVDVVLMDLRMPTMGGVEAIRRLRRIAPATHVLVAHDLRYGQRCAPRHRGRRDRLSAQGRPTGRTDPGGACGEQR